MLTPSTFAPLASSAGPSSLRSSRYRPSHKRKHSAMHSPTDSDSSSSTSTSSVSSSTSTSTTPPAHPFPHARSPRTKPPSLPHLPSGPSAHLATLSPPLFAMAAAPTASGPQPPSRRRPAVPTAPLSALLHAALLRRDWAVAARAWAALLRAQPGLDVRKGGAWGVGAEVLLRSGGDDEGGGGGAGEVGEKGLRRARAFLERLVVQFPAGRGGVGGGVEAGAGVGAGAGADWGARDRADAWTFYEALFGVWIREVVESGEAARARARARAKARARDHWPGDGDPPPNMDPPTSATAATTPSPALASPSGSESSESTPSPNNRRHGLHPLLECRILSTQHRAAAAIAARLDELFAAGPPFDRHAPLLELRANVGLWVADLLEERAEAAELGEEWSGEEVEEEGILEGEEGAGGSGGEEEEDGGEERRRAWMEEARGERERAGEALRMARRVREGI
ncbi:hypothetical protein BDY21DRAFT_397015 [Lineolata rhizophorae]|uniref:Uncharacterized protein n=1 Tax=Lineolata rhizophorae TaxID=578093 RepID=A0A6A6NUA2_9PEZI|nr:hypothetical protein BDY21DRAFT_397015 [Lineolata rhizophorae]